MKKRLRVCMAIIAAMMVCFNVSAQQMIKGTLRSQTGEPLPGASVSVKGTNTAVTTNSKGEFTINAPVGSVLVVSYIGYNNQEVTIADANTPLNIQMQANNQELQQVVVIGYQTVRRRDLTGAVSVVNSENTSKIVAASVAEQLQGTVPGVTVRNTGNPNQAPVIEIRGVASFADANPLYV
ncbi:MAG TPA: carboxypeptidase-like regulatory domain-containing protein, partial [Flavisolibacter sp.]|nr:carboxypeptidase-like regulatory domain-containing protein [Flavisolibacter sp.]